MPDHAGALPDWHAACAQVAVDFAVAIDHEDFGQVLSLFTVDGSVNRMGEVFEGRNGLRAWLDERPKQLIRHLCSNFSGRLVASNEVHGVTYFTAYREICSVEIPAHNTIPMMIGEWENVFSLTSQGWRIKTLAIKPVFVAAR